MTTRHIYGLPLGVPINNKRRGPIWDQGDGHLITFAPTGAGKGVSCIIPALLAWNGPAIVIDPKGENYAVTASRRAQLGQRVYLLDPFGVTGADQVDGLNPLDLVTPGSPIAADDAAVVAKLMVRGGHLPSDPFWDQRAEALIIGLILFVLAENAPHFKNLIGVRHHIESPRRDIQLLAGQMLLCKSPEVRVAMNILTLEANRTRESILTTASSHTAFLRSGPVANATTTSSIDLGEIVAGAGFTIYIVLPPDKLRSHAPLLRLWLGVLMAAMTRRRTKPQHSTLLLIDEAAQLGPLEELRTAVTLMRGYGVKCWSFWQDLSQLQRIYPLDWRSLVNNCSVQQYFGLSMPQVAAELDAYLAGASPKPLGRLQAEEGLLIRRNHRPIVVTRPDYMRDAMFKGHARPNPFYQPCNTFEKERTLDGSLPWHTLKFPNGRTH